MKSSGKSASHRPVSKVPPKSLHHIDDEEYQAKLEAAWKKAKDEEKKAGYIALLGLAKNILEQCIQILGFEAPEKM